MAKNNDIEKAREALLSSLNKTFKTDVIRKYTITQELPRISTSYFLFDDILGGGIPEGRIIEIYGWESSGKSFLTTKIMAAAQKQGKAVMLFDAENAFHTDFAKQCGLDVDSNFAYSDEQNASIIFGTIKRVCEANAQRIEEGEKPLYDVIVVDSVATLLTEYEEEHDTDKSKIGDLAKVMSIGLKKLPRVASTGKTTIIFINQVRNNIGVMYGDPETTPGGNALKFYSSLRIKLRRLGGKEGKIYEGKDLVGHKVVATVVKNKTAPPHKKAEFALFYDGRTDDTEDIIELGDKYGIWEIKGNIRTYTTDDGVEIRENGKPKMTEAIRSGGKALRDELINKIMEKIKSNKEDILSDDEKSELEVENGLDWTEETDSNTENDLDDF